MYSADTSSPGTLRSRFTDGSIETASGERVIVMCFDRLERDLDGALTSIASADHDTTNSLLGHAQDLIAEMVAMLDIDAWDHAPALLSIYNYLLRRLAQANAYKDAAGVSEARRLISEIGDGFRGAATALAAAPAPTPDTAAPSPTFGANDAGDRPRLSIQA